MFLLFSICYTLYIFIHIHSHIYVYMYIYFFYFVLTFPSRTFSFPSRSALAIFLTPLAGLLPLVKLPEAAPFSESQSVILVQIKSILFLFE